MVDAPWTLDMEFLTKHKIGIFKGGRQILLSIPLLDFVAHDDEPYTIGSSSVRFS